jgi:sulfotransferase famil protein
MPQLQPIIIHCHIFKNAGSTFDFSLGRSFQHKLRKFDVKGQPANIVSYDVIRSKLDEDSNIMAFSSHQLNLPLLPYDYPRPILPIMFVRHPVDRIESAYYYYKRLEPSAQPPTMRKAVSKDFNGFVQLILGTDEGVPYRNMQVRKAARADRKLVIDDADYDNALKYIGKCLFVGCVERYDASIVILEDKLKPFFPNIDLSYVKQNITPERATTLKGRLEKMKSTIGEEAFEKLVRWNKYDFALRRHVISKIDGIVDSDPDFQDKLDAFRRRCKKLKLQLAAKAKNVNVKTKK